MYPMLCQHESGENSAITMMTTYDIGPVAIQNSNKLMQKDQW